MNFLVAYRKGYLTHLEDGDFTLCGKLVWGWTLQALEGTPTCKKCQAKQPTEPSKP